MTWIFKKDYQTTSINVLVDQKVNINIYPIPSVNYLNVELETNTCVQYEIISILGETLASDYFVQKNR